MILTKLGNYQISIPPRRHSTILQFDLKEWFRQPDYSLPNWSLVGFTLYIVGNYINSSAYCQILTKNNSHKIFHDNGPWNYNRWLIPIVIWTKATNLPNPLSNWIRLNENSFHIPKYSRVPKGTTRPKHHHGDVGTRWSSSWIVWYYVHVHR